MKFIHVTKSNYKHRNIIVFLILVNYIIITVSFIPASIQDDLPVVFDIFFSQTTNTKYDLVIDDQEASIQGSATMNAGNTELSGGDYSVTPAFNAPSKPPKENLDTAYAYPNPCKVYEGDTEIKFADLTKDAEIKIYTISGKLVKILDKTTDTSEQAWDLKNGVGQSVASGVYIYIIKNGSMAKRGKVVVIR